MIERVEIRNQGAPVKWVWLHGMFGGAMDLLSMVEFLPRDHDVEAWVFPGHGGSKTIPDFSAVVAELVRLLNEEIAAVLLMGYSMGGRFALASAAKNPLSLAGTVVLSASAGIASKKARLHRALWDAQWASRLECQSGAVVHREWLAQNLFSTISKTTKWRLLQQRKHLEPIPIANAMRRFGQGAQLPLHDELGEIKRPVYLVSGALDEKYVEAQQEIQKRISTAKIGVVDDAGHAVHLEKPAKLGALVTLFSTQCIDDFFPSDSFLPRAPT